MNHQNHRNLKRAFLPVVLLGVLALLAGCGGGGTTGSGTVPASLSFSATSGTGGTAATTLSAPQTTLTSGVTVDTFRMGVTKIEMDNNAQGPAGTSVVTSDGSSPDPNGGSDSASQSGDVAEFKGQFIVDFIAGTVQDLGTGGAATSVTGFLPAGSYDELHFKAGPLAGVDPSAPTTPVTLLIGGSYTSPTDGLLRTFTISVTVPFDFNVEGLHSIVLDGNSNDLILAFQLDTLLSPANLDTLLGNTEITTQPSPGVYDVSVTPATSAQTLGQLQQMLEKALHFGEDQNGDHELESGEDVSGNS
jgi:hypothetical protein